MRKLVLLLLLCVFSLPLLAQRKSNFNTIDRKAGLFNNTYKNTYSGSFTYGILSFNGDLGQTTETQSTTKNITINKQINADLSMSTKVSFGELYGQGDVYNSEYDYTTNNVFSNSFLATSLMVKKQLNGDKESKSRTFKINLAAGLGLISSEINLHPDYSVYQDSYSNFKTFFIPINLDFEYFFTPHFGLIIASELNYCFSDKMDLEGVEFSGLKDLTKMDVFTGFTAGICIKLE